MDIYAFERNLQAAATMIGRAPNFIVVPMAVSDTDGRGSFHIKNASNFASSLLPLREEGMRSWAGVNSIAEGAVRGQRGRPSAWILS